MGNKLKEFWNQDILQRKELPEISDNEVVVPFPLDNGATVDIRFNKTRHNKELGAIQTIEDWWANASSRNRALLFERKLKEQYDMSAKGYASALIGRIADEATWGAATWLGHRLAAAFDEGEGSFGDKVKRASASERVGRTMGEAITPTSMALAEGTGLGINPLMAHPLIKGLGRISRGAGRTPGLQGVTSRAGINTRNLAPTSPRAVNYGVLNPAVVAHPGRLTSIGEAAGKGGLWGYAANALNNDTGEVNIDPASARSGLEFGGGIQAILNAAGPVGKALGKVIPRGGRPQAGNALPGETLENSDFARRRLAAAHEDFSTIDSLFGESIDPTVQMRQAHDAALREGVGTFGNTANIPSLLGPQAEALAVQSAKVAPRSGQRLMDQAAENAALQRERLHGGLLDSANVPRETAEQSLALEKEAVDQASATHRELAYTESVPMTGSINSLKAFDGWDKIYRSTRSDRKSQVKGSDDPLLTYDPDNGMPNLLPKSFNDFIDGVRYIPIRQYNKLVNKHGGDLPFEKVEVGGKAVRVNADGVKVEKPTHYKVKLENPSGDIRTLHALRIKLDRSFDQGDLVDTPVWLKKQTRNSMDRLVKKDIDMVAHDSQVANLKAMEEAAKRGAEAGKSTQTYWKANEQYRTNPDTKVTTKNDERRIFRQSLLDNIRDGGVTVEQITTGNFGELNKRLRLVFDDLPNADAAYNKFLAGLAKEEKAAGLSGRLGRHASAVEIPTATETIGSRVLRLTAKVPAYMFSAEFGMQRDFMESWKSLMKGMTKGEASAINRISMLKPGTPEFAKEIDELQKIYLRTKQTKKFRTAQNIGAFMAESVHEHDENYALMSQAGPRHSRPDQQEKKINPATRAAESIFDMAGEYAGDIWDWGSEISIPKKKRP